ncbi:HAD-IA family hydrolase [Beijerinckia sp. L45]|uniref:HAD-IA family hydrolase n=1 Tax=Beijerinckia sp. L45 TaxID=1641855 RepID=UPI00131B83B2|nr:HAD-IA family hydrolase [Beijerinckia sp. L45]
MPYPTLQALIFDVDGTLAETEELHRRSFNETFRQHGLDWNWDESLYAKLLQTTGGKERMVRYVADYVPHQRDVLDNLSVLHKAKTKNYQSLLHDGALALRPGVVRLVHEARTRGLKLAIATTSNPHNVKALLRSGLGDDSPNWFTIAAGDVAPLKKPSPDVYYQALEAMDVGPGNAVAFEDSSNGLQAALTAGLAVVATPSRFLTEENLEGALSVISDLGEPDKPFHHIAGAAFAKGYVDVDGLGAVFAAAQDRA